MVRSAGQGEAPMAVFPPAASGPAWAQAGAVPRRAAIRHAARAVLPRSAVALAAVAAWWGVAQVSAARPPAGLRAAIPDAARVAPRSFSVHRVQRAARCAARSARAARRLEATLGPLAPQVRRPAAVRSAAVRGATRPEAPGASRPRAAVPGAAPRAAARGAAPAVLQRIGAARRALSVQWAPAARRARACARHVAILLRADQDPRVAAVRDPPCAVARIAAAQSRPLAVSSKPTHGDRSRHGARAPASARPDRRA